ncbi:T9SS type A sorting domain-containing protein [candidate division KSB1 bacterium]|nr:T9SS type A sorting domain-containing protein [candidate division KSB1 bacterium]
MMKKIKLGLLLGLTMLLIANLALAADRSGSGSKLDKTLTRKIVKYIDINQIRSSVMNDATFSFHPVASASDMEWPKGSGKYICFGAGIWLAGKIDGQIRTACSDYRQEYQPGVILPDGTADDPAKTEYRVYKIHKEFPNGDEELEIDTWEDWETYAEKQGAPKLRDDSGNWIGLGDEMLYCVMNDLNPNDHNTSYHTLPIGIELHQLIFGFDRSGALGNCIFIKYTIINKGARDLDSTYVAAWSDVDNGDANDDLIGFDMDLGMSFCYGGKPVDATYGSRPPALGWDFFQGPIVDSPGDVVVLPNGRIYQDKKILSATAFTKYYNGHAVYADPQTNAQGAEEVWYYMSGTQRDGTPWINPITGQPSPFTNTGDPVTGEGWLSTNENPPSDIRMLTSAGPFTLAAGDTQEIVVGCVIGQGSDRISSISVLRFFDQEAQQAYDLGFNVPSPPPPPKVTVSELDREVLVSWEKNAEDFKSTYQFEGYNVYVGSSPGGPWTRLATYDLANEVGVVLEPSFDTNSGQILNLPSAYGNNLGTKYRYLFTKDYDGLTLANGRTYYFLVTSYAYDPNSIPTILESRRDIIYAVPHKAAPGTIVGHGAYETIKVEHTAGEADPSKYEVWVQIIDPLSVETADYKIKINEDRSWTLLKNGVEIPEYTNVTTYGIDTDIEYRDLTNSPLDFFIGLTANFAEDFYPLYWDPELIAGNELVLENLSSPQRQGIRTTDLAVDGQFKKGTMNPDILYNPLQIRFTGEMDSTTMKVTSGGSLATLFFSFGDPANFMSKHPENPNPGTRDPFLVKIPFEVWDVERNMQLNVSFTDNAQKISDADFVPTWAPRGNCIVYVVASAYDEQIHNIGFTGQDTMATWTFQFTPGAVWQTGDIIQLNIADPDTFIYYNPVVPGVEEFSFRIQGKETGVVSDAKQRLNIINVYPNPYLAHNVIEKQLHEEQVVFFNLPEKCTIRIFTISGQLVRTIEHNDPTSITASWNLRNENYLPVASGLYVAHIEAPGIGTKILKMAIVFRQQQLKNL